MYVCLKVCLAVYEVEYLKVLVGLFVSVYKAKMSLATFFRADKCDYLLRILYEYKDIYKNWIFYSNKIQNKVV